MTTLVATRLNGARWPVACLAAAAVLSGCMNMSGLDASSNYSCPAPPGVVCKPMSEVYRTPASATTDSAPSKTKAVAVAPREPSEDIQFLNSTLPAAPFAIGDYQPLRSLPKVLRIWVAPFQDSDGDLHEEHRMYLQVDSGHWMIKHHEEEIRSAFAPLHAHAPTTNAAGNVSGKSDLPANKMPPGNLGSSALPSGVQSSAFDSVNTSGASK